MIRLTRSVLTTRMKLAWILHVSYILLKKRTEVIKNMTLKKKIINIITVLLSPILTFYLFEYLTHNPFKTMKMPAQILNILLFEILMLLLVTAFGRIRRALMTQTAFFLIVGIANYFVLQFRSAPIMPWDIFSIKTAASVADNFQYTMDKQAILSSIGLIVLLVLEFFLTSKERFINWKIRLSGALVSCLLLYGFTVMIQADSSVSRFKLYDKLFTPTTMSYKDGTALAFLMELEYLIVDKPEGYNASEAADQLASYSPSEKEEANATNNENLPNIIVIMNEAFSDLSVLDDFETNQDYMPFVHSLMENGANTKSGYLHVSVLGGNTANTEFEFLTGNSMAFLPQGSIPYQQYMKGEIPSIASYLKEYGYTTVGMHPYHASGWERDTVYPLLGLDTNYFIDDFENAEIVRKYVSDKADYEKVIEIFEQKEEGEPLFLFNVTMQNHSSYSDSYDNFTPDISVEGADSDVLNNYLSLIHLSDSSLEFLLSYFEQVDEPTIIVFFGDHQPTNSVVRPIWNLNGKSDSTLTEEENARRYEVPYIIWANYPIESEHGVDTSANLLGAKVLETAGIPQSSYTAYLSDLSESFPVISAIQAVDADGNAAPINTWNEELLPYRQLQYYMLFDYNTN